MPKKITSWDPIIFKVYVEIQMSGKTNMADTKKVVELSGGFLTEKDVRNVRSNYDKFVDKFRHLQIK